MVAYMKNLVVPNSFFDPIQHNLQPYIDLASALKAAGHDTTDLDNAINKTKKQVAELREIAVKSRDAFNEQGFKGNTGQYFKECEQDSLT